MTSPKNTPSPRFEDLFVPETGDTYEEFWNNVAQTKEGAYLGVFGLFHHQNLDDEDMEISGEPDAEIIANKLEIEPSHKVLEIGVGVGRIAQHMAARCAEFHGVDISENMIREARARLRGIPGVHLKTLERSGLLDAFPDASFDRIYSHIVLIHLDREDVLQYMREASRVLRPGGRAFFQVNNLMHPTGFRYFQDLVNQTMLKGRAQRGRVHFLTAHEVRAYVAGAGLTVLEDKSNLELHEQTFDFIKPNLHWDYYLIAVAEKPFDRST
ncbi:MAG: class I SAM-dependent methyltransferase [Planctomycetota bacterium]|jgi:cyclopropane fatty-acyl-phospholipid synthase-like methyltransferase